MRPYKLECLYLAKFFQGMLIITITARNNPDNGPLLRTPLGLVPAVLVKIVHA